MEGSCSRARIIAYVKLFFWKRLEGKQLGFVVYGFNLQRLWFLWIMASKPSTLNATSFPGSSLYLEVEGGPWERGSTERTCKLCSLVQVNKWYCYIARLSRDKMSNVIGWFLFTCPRSNPNASRPGYNCAVVVRMALCLFVFAKWLFKGKSKYITKHLMYGPSGNLLVLFSLESWCFPRLLLGKHQDSRENKTNCFPRDHTLTV